MAVFGVRAKRQARKAPEPLALGERLARRGNHAQAVQQFTKHIAALNWHRSTVDNVDRTDRCMLCLGAFPAFAGR